MSEAGGWALAVAVIGAVVSARGLGHLGQRLGLRPPLPEILAGILMVPAGVSLLGRELSERLLSGEDLRLVPLLSATTLALLRAGRVSPPDPSSPPPGPG